MISHRIPALTGRGCFLYYHSYEKTFSITQNTDVYRLYRGSNKLETRFLYGLIHQKELVIFVQQWQKTAKKIVEAASSNLTFNLL